MRTQDRKKMIDQFRANFIFDERNFLKPQVKIKNYSDGSRYEGTLIGDKRNGKGIYYYENGDVFLGEWRDDQFNG